MKKTRFKVPPVLTDGDHWSVVDTPDQVAELVKEACDNMLICEDKELLICLELIEMSDKEVEEMPEL